jgi:hypothetical protein
MVKLVKEAIPGQLIIDGGRIALCLSTSESEHMVYLTYALYTMGVESHILPSVILDDWGNEIRGMSLYAWFREYGERFPRAEVFGVAPDGTETQYFLRDLELYSKYPVYAFPEKDGPISTGILLDAVVYLDGDVTTPIMVSPPTSISAPLRDARVSWWAVPSFPDQLGFLETTS